MRVCKTGCCQRLILSSAIRGRGDLRWTVAELTSDCLDSGTSWHHYFFRIRWATQLLETSNAQPSHINTTLAQTLQHCCVHYALVVAPGADGELSLRDAPSIGGTFEQLPLRLTLSAQIPSPFYHQLLLVEYTNYLRAFHLLPCWKTLTTVLVLLHCSILCSRAKIPLSSTSLSRLASRPHCSSTPWTDLLQFCTIVRDAGTQHHCYAMAARQTVCMATQAVRKFEALQAQKYELQEPGLESHQPQTREPQRHEPRVYEFRIHRPLSQPNSSIHSTLSVRVWRQMHVQCTKQRPQPSMVSSRPPITAALPARSPTSPNTKRPARPPKLAELCTKQEKRYRTTTTSTVKPRSRECFRPEPSTPTI